MENHVNGNGNDGSQYMHGNVRWRDPNGELGHQNDSGYGAVGEVDHAQPLIPPEHIIQNQMEMAARQGGLDFDWFSWDQFVETTNGGMPMPDIDVDVGSVGGLPGIPSARVPHGVGMADMGGPTDMSGVAGLNGMMSGQHVQHGTAHP
jgi:hypothetical protein